MKTFLTNLMTSAVLLCTIGSGLEAQTIRMQANVPFAWQVEGRQQNAGTVVISRDANLPVAVIENKTTGARTYVSVRPGSEKDANASRLVFHRYGNQYFLAEVHAPGMAVRNLPITQAEKQAAEAANETASNETSSGTSNRSRMTTVFVNIVSSGK